MKKAIVTGATGFIGSWLVQELLKNGVETTVVVRDRFKLLFEFRENPQCIIVEKSIEELTVVDFKDLDYDVFFHLGWGGVAPEQKNEIKLQLNNVSISLAALELSKLLRCKKFIGAGTVA